MLKKTLAASLLLCLATPRVGPQDGVAGTTAAAVRRLRADVEALASDDLKGRRAGTPEANAAAQYVADAFRKIGLLPGGTRGSYLQTFDFIDGVELGPKNALVTQNGAPVGKSWTVGTDFRPLAFSAPGSADGDVVFVGYGISRKDLGYDDYAGLDVKGKVVLALRYGPDGNDEKSSWSPFTPLRYKASVAREKGAKALLVATGPATPDVADDLVSLRTDTSFSDLGLVVVSVKRPVAEHLFAGSGKTLEEAQKAIDAGRKPAPLALAGRVSLTADVSPHREKTSNVIAVLPGTDPALNTEFLVIGAHYDHLGLGGSGSLEPPGAPGAAPKIHHGADDNASGVAGILELARRLAVRKRTLRRSTLFIAFGGEEEGALGSLHFTKEPTVPLDRIVAMVNLDMVGRLRDDALDLHGVETSPAWKPLIEKANAELKLRLKPHAGGFGPSDHSSFTAVQKPVLFAFTGNHADYHRSSDTADKLNAEGEDKVLRFLQPIAESVLSSPERIAYSAVAGDRRPNAPPPGAIRPWVGSIPDYSEEGTGLKLSGVWEGSPAEKAGIKRGDVIVMFAGREIKNIYDYTYALQEHEPGETVKVAVRRTEQGAARTVEVDLTLGVRPNASR